MKKDNVILDKSFNFSLQIIELYKILIAKKEFVLSKQLVRCGTSIGANVFESTAAQSKKDFITKLSIASKEARETLYWLKLLDESKLVEFDYPSYKNNTEEIIKILTSIVKTTQERYN